MTFSEYQRTTTSFKSLHNSGTYPASGSNILHLPLSDGRRIHSTPDGYEHSPESDSMAQDLRHSSPNNTYPPLGNNISKSHPHASTSQPQPPAHSFNLFIYSPNQGLVHQNLIAPSTLDPTWKHVCTECGRRYAHHSNLRQHLLKHPFTCGRQSSVVSNMWDHMPTQTAGKSFPCTHPGCGRWFKWASDLEHCKCAKHLLSHHAPTGA